VLQKNTLLGRLLVIVHHYKSFISSKEPMTDKWDLVLMGGMVGSMFSFLQFFVSPFIGSLSDRVGRRKTLLLTMVTSNIYLQRSLEKTY
jgi:MFS family permease